MDDGNDNDRIDHFTPCTCVQDNEGNPRIRPNAQGVKQSILLSIFAIIIIVDTKMAKSGCLGI